MTATRQGRAYAVIGATSAAPPSDPYPEPTDMKSSLITRVISCGDYRRRLGDSCQAIAKKISAAHELGGRGPLTGSECTPPRWVTVVSERGGREERAGG